LLPYFLVLLAVQNDENLLLEFFPYCLVDLGVKFRQTRLIAAEDLLKPNADTLLDMGLGIRSWSHRKGYS
jgi:hypothetical protein